MIDFRYHLVSLISVFLALAIGVVLGAGPLQNSLGTALNDQVTSLRQDRNAMQAQLEQTETAVNERDSYITTAAASYLPGVLAERKVALIVLPEAAAQDIESITTELETASATVVGRVTLTTAWVDKARETFRASHSGDLTAHLETTGSAPANEILGRGLGTALTTSGDKATTLRDLLTTSETPLMNIEADLSAPADTLVVIGPRTTVAPGADPTPAPANGMDLKAWTVAMKGIASTGPTVVVGAADTTTDLVAVLRTAETSVTTVDSVGQATASVSVPLALAAVVRGESGHYGFNDAAVAVMPPVQPAPKPEAAATETATGS